MTNNNQYEQQGILVRYLSLRGQDVATQGSRSRMPDQMISWAKENLGELNDDDIAMQAVRVYEQAGIPLVVIHKATTLLGHKFYAVNTTKLDGGTIELLQRLDKSYPNGYPVRTAESTLLGINPIEFLARDYPNLLLGYTDVSIVGVIDEKMRVMVRDHGKVPLNGW